MLLFPLLVESNTEFDFDGLRLDWIRLQVISTKISYENLEIKFVF